VGGREFNFQSPILKRDIRRVCLNIEVNDLYKNFYHNFNHQSISLTSDMGLWFQAQIYFKNKAAYLLAFNCFIEFLIVLALGYVSIQHGI